MDQAMFEKFPRFESLCRILSEELLAKSRGQLDDFKTSNAEQRYLNVQRSRPELLHRVPQYQLASYLGITPQSLSRLRSRLASKRRSA
jgi:CRP-like cAMP-binding protein